MSYLVMRRHRTPKGEPGKVEQRLLLNMETVLEWVAKNLPISCWLHIEDSDLVFKGATPISGSDGNGPWEQLALDEPETARILEGAFR